MGGKINVVRIIILLNSYSVSIFFLKHILTIIYSYVNNEDLIGKAIETKNCYKLFIGHYSFITDICNELPNKSNFRNNLICALLSKGK